VRGDRVLDKRPVEKRISPQRGGGKKKKKRGQVTATADDSLTSESRDSPSVDVTLTGGFTPVTARERECRNSKREAVFTQKQNMIVSPVQSSKYGYVHFGYK